MSRHVNKIKCEEMNQIVNCVSIFFEKQISELMVIVMNRRIFLRLSIDGTPDWYNTGKPAAKLLKYPRKSLTGYIERSGITVYNSHKV